MDIVKIARTTLSIWGGQLIPFTLIAAALLIPSLCLDLVGSWLGAEDLTSALGKMSRFVTSVAQNVTVGIVAYSTIHALNGQRISLQESARQAFSAIGAILVAGILYNLASGFGLLLCIVPGIIVMVACYVVIPAVVVEKLNGQEALQRSVDLTRGSRAQIFGAVMLLLGPAILMFFATAIGAAIAVELVVDTEANPHLDRFTSMGLDVVIWALLSPLTSLSAVLCSVIYAELRQQRDEVSIDDLLQVFD